jgi:hypothetical protein
VTLLYSQNGWIASPDRDAILIHNFDVPGTKRHFSCSSKVAPILIAFAAEYHKIQPIDVGTYDDWGYNFAKIPNSNDYSNHCSGTAIDINATLHQWKSSKSGFTPTQEKAIDALCAKYGIRWGWRYKSGFKDPMHFEAIETPAQVAKRIIDMKLPMPAISK